MARPDQVFHLQETEKKLGYARAVRSGDMLFLAGTCSVGLDNEVVAPGDMRGQIAQIYSLITVVLEAHEATFENVVKEMIFVSDIEAFRDALPVRAGFYEGAAPPAATWLEVSGFMRPDFLIEIEVTAELPREH
ncbi:MAG: Rid family hydrolase [Alphaproteobacteria bacterium]|jgi:enamine deaminase RidA (YjgF/YER057c/UK114 family)|nr:Rid family hydrolase [Alphaproteobacteria bacterium]MDP6517061.1 Rid family hydrolase [Alphaproteobacteria bacterium]|tara:strand:- start:223 stop:624 length:402 start_codon:yes stop_codon:yes gene_type:complete